MSGESRLVSIIILSWNEKDLLNQCLASIKDNTSFSDYRIIVVDNGSIDGTCDMVRTEHPDADLVALDENHGFPKGMNIGIEYASRKHDPDYYVLMNQDIEVRHEDWLEFLVEPTITHSAGVVGCRIVYPDGTPQFVGAEIKNGGAKLNKTGEPDEITILNESEFIYGACFLVSEEVIKKIGVLDEGFSPYNWEEADYCMRCHSKGINLAYTPKAEIVHQEGQSKETISSFHYRTNKENHLRFMLLNLSAKDLIKRIPYELAEIKSILLDGSQLESDDNIYKLSLVLTSYYQNLISLPEILEKRYNRDKKLFYSRGPIEK